MAKSKGAFPVVVKGKPKPTTPVPSSSKNRGGGVVNSHPTVPSNPNGGWGHK